MLFQVFFVFFLLSIPREVVASLVYQPCILPVGNKDIVNENLHSTTGFSRIFVALSQQLRVCQPSFGM